MNDLFLMGFGPFFLAQLDVDDLDPYRIARVVFQAHGHLRVVGPSARGPGVERLLIARGAVAVGDWVLTDPTGVAVERVLEPRTRLGRRDPGGGVQVMAANCDRAMICVPAAGDPNLRRLERWLAVAAEAEVEPLVVLTKADWGVDAATSIDAIRGISEVPVVAVSARDDLGREALLAWLEPGRTAALLGLSGVGKSTLLNWLCDAEVRATGGLREADGKGRHTTTDRHLFQLPNGAWILDNPGVRTVGVVGEEGVGLVFGDIEALAERCRFRDCAHRSEPGCAVLAAVDAGELDAERFAAWNKLVREVAFEARKEDAALWRAERDRWKKVHVAARKKRRLEDA